MCRYTNFTAKEFISIYHESKMQRKIFSKLKKSFKVFPQNSLRPICNIYIYINITH